MTARDPVAMALGIIPEAAPRASRLLLPEVPDPYRSAGELARWTHADLATMSGDELARERIRTRLAWAQPHAEQWWSERVAAIESEIARRRGAP